MGENNENVDVDGDQQHLIDQIELASEIVRSSQAVVAFQRAFFLEILTFDRVHKEIEDFMEKVKKLQNKLSMLLNDLTMAENVSGVSRATVILEKLETLTNSSKEFYTKSIETKRRREPIYNDLNGMIHQELNNATVKSVTSSNFRDVRPPNLSVFVNDTDFHLIEYISEEWGTLRRKLEGYMQKYVEDTISLRVEVFGATYINGNNTTLTDTSSTSPNNSTHGDENGRGLMQKLSGLILSKKANGSGSHLNQLSVNLGPLHSRSNSHSNVNSRTPSGRTETSFFYCSDSDSQSHDIENRENNSTHDAQGVTEPLQKNKL